MQKIEDRNKDEFEISLNKLVLIESLPHGDPNGQESSLKSLLEDGWIVSRISINESSSSKLHKTALELHFRLAELCSHH